MAENAGGARRHPRSTLGYVIAAYVVVIAVLVGYGLRIQVLRRAQRRAAPAAASREKI